MGTLLVFDDDQTGFEGVRLRNSTFRIGRQGCHLNLDHDRQVSRSHAEIRREKVGDGYVWSLHDLKSRNGVFLCRPAAPLRDGVRVRIGGTVVRVEIRPGGRSIGLTQIEQQDAESIELEPGRYRIGTDAGLCVPFLQKSRFLDPCQVRLESDASGAWQMFDDGTVNGLWFELAGGSVELAHGDRFQLGEQRFEFRLP